MTAPVCGSPINTAAVRELSISTHSPSFWRCTGSSYTTAVQEPSVRRKCLTFCSRSAVSSLRMKGASANSPEDNGISVAAVPCNASKFSSASAAKASDSGSSINRKAENRLIRRFFENRIIIFLLLFIILPSTPMHISQ